MFCWLVLEVEFQIIQIIVNMSAWEMLSYPHLYNTLQAVQKHHLIISINNVNLLRVEEMEWLNLNVNLGVHQN